MRAVTDWLAGRTPRERWMLIGLAVVAGGILLFYGVVQPLYGWREAAAERRVEATEATRLIAAAEARMRPGATSDPARLAEVAGPLAEAKGWRSSCRPATTAVWPSAPNRRRRRPCSAGWPPRKTSTA